MDIETRWVKLLPPVSEPWRLGLWSSFLSMLLRRHVCDIPSSGVPAARVGDLVGVSDSNLGFAPALASVTIWEANQWKEDLPQHHHSALQMDK